MFAKRHEDDLAEIKALTLELSQRFDLIHAQLERIEEAQHKAVRVADPSEGPPRRKVRAAGTDAKKKKPKAGAKKARRREVGVTRKGERKAKRRLEAAEEAKPADA